VPVFLLGLCFPFLDGGQAFDSSAFVSHDGMIGKAPSHGFRIMPVLGGDIGRNGFGRSTDIWVSPGQSQSNSDDQNSFVASTQV